MTDMRMEKNTVKEIKKKLGIRTRESVCVCVSVFVCECVLEREREGRKEMALVFKQKGKAKHFGEL